MLIARAPMRISFAGGGTDLEAYYQARDGLVISAAINKYIYAILSTGECDDLQIISADVRSLYRLPAHEELFWDGDLALPKAILHQFGLRAGVNVFLASEIPPGTGLGSSSALAVALTTALSALCRQPLTKQQVAELACYVEIEKLGMPIGKQDQFASAFGGLNSIEFTPSGVTVQPLRITSETRLALERRLLLFFTGISRESANILRSQRASTLQRERRVLQALDTIKRIAIEAQECLERGDLDGFAALLHAGWEHKKRVAKNISNAFIDESYQIARTLGAAGGKITGAGGGGFLLLYSEEQYQEAITRALEGRGLRRLAFRFDDQGTTVLVNLAAFDPGWMDPAWSGLLPHHTPEPPVNEASVNGHGAETAA